MSASSQVFPIDFQSRSDQERHAYILQQFVFNKQNQKHNSRHKHDIDVIREHHRFLWDNESPAQECSWEERLARRYYDKLFKEYCIADLSRHKENKIAMRWRTESEVVQGTGQFQCASLKCTQSDELRTWEVNFAYMEHGQRKNALVKLRLCPEHSAQLNYTSKKREVKRLRHQVKEQKRQNKLAKKLRRKKRRSANNSDDEQGDCVEERNDDDDDDTCRNSDGDNAEVNDESAEQEQDFAEDIGADEFAASEDIWRKKTVVPTQVAPEEEFERYLEDLLF